MLFRPRMNFALFEMKAVSYLIRVHSSAKRKPGS